MRSSSTAVCFSVVWSARAGRCSVVRKGVAAHRERLLEEMHEIHGTDQDGLHWEYSGVGGRENGRDGGSLVDGAP